MQLVEQHRIDHHDPRWKAIDQAAFASKNLYNVVSYRKRQAFIHEKTILTLAHATSRSKRHQNIASFPPKSPTGSSSKSLRPGAVILRRVRNMPNTQPSFWDIPSCRAI